MPGAFTAVDPSNIDNILAAVITVADTPISGITWGQKWSPHFPIADDLAQYPFPQLVVMEPEHFGYYVGGAYAGKEMPARVSAEIEQSWDIQVYGLWPFGNVTDAVTYTTPRKALVALQQVFTLQYTLQRSCTRAWIAGQEIGPFRVGNNPYSLDNAKPYYGVHITLRCDERMNLFNSEV